MAQQTEASVVKTKEEEEFAEWLLHPVTKKLKAMALKEYEGLKDKWAHGEMSNENPNVSALNSANAIGKCEVLYTLATLKFEDLEVQDD